MDRDFNYCISLRTCSPALLIMVECPLQDPYLEDAVQAAAADPGFGVTTCHFSDPSSAMSQTICLFSCDPNLLALGAFRTHEFRKQSIACQLAHVWI